MAEEKYWQIREDLVAKKIVTLIVTLKDKEYSNKWPLVRVSQVVEHDVSRQLKVGLGRRYDGEVRNNVQR